MKRSLTIGIALAVIAGQASAAPPPLKCTSSTGQQTADVVVDLHKRVLLFGPDIYRIQAVTEKYITAYQLPQDQVGGEIWVLDRKTGDYTRVSLSMGWDSMDAVKKKEPANLAASKYTGKCLMPIP